MSAVAVFPNLSSEETGEESVNRKLHPDQSGDADYEESMTKADEVEMRESIHALLLSNTVLSRALTQRIEQPLPAVPTRTVTDRAVAIIPTFLMCATILYTFAFQKASTETDLRAQVALAESTAKRAQQNVLLLDTYNRELERALMQARTTVKLPTYPVLDK